MQFIEVQKNFELEKSDRSRRVKKSKQRPLSDHGDTFRIIRYILGVPLNDSSRRPRNDAKSERTTPYAMSRGALNSCKADRFSVAQPSLLMFSNHVLLSK